MKAKINSCYFCISVARREKLLYLYLRDRAIIELTFKFNIIVVGNSEWHGMHLLFTTKNISFRMQCFAKNCPMSIAEETSSNYFSSTESDYVASSYIIPGWLQ